MTFWTLDNLRGVMGGTWLARPGDADKPSPLAQVDGVCTDSRHLKPGNCFIALRGETTDGHLYLTHAANAGAGMLVVDRAEALTDDVRRAMRRDAGGAGGTVGSAGAAVLLVADTGQALLRLAAAYRKTLDTTRVIAVAGSNGKTTTVRLVHAVLGDDGRGNGGKLRGTSSPKSFNNAVGVPLTILGAKKSDQFLICEVGTNAPGEIATLAGVVEPDIAVITSIGREHLEGLGSLRGVLQEEASLLAGLRPGGVAIVNADAPGLVEAARAMTAAHRGDGPGGGGRQVVTFGANERADIRITDAGQSAAGPQAGVRFTLNGRFAYRLNLLGLHNASNAAAAVAVARRLGVENADIERGLLAAKGPPMRLDRIEVATPSGPIVFINDAYNANPDSTLAAIRAFADLLSGDDARRVIVLGDMLELGDQAPDLHREVGDAVIASGVVRPGDLVILVGRLSLFIADRLSRGLASDQVALFDDLATKGADAASLLRPGDRVLLKGSRRMGLERIIDAARARAPAPPGPTLPDPKSLALEVRPPLFVSQRSP